EADCLAVSGGWNPTLHLSCHTGERPVWNPAISAFVPSPNLTGGLQVAGAAAGVFSTKNAIKSGYYRAKLILKELGVNAPAYRPVDADENDPAVVPLWSVPGKGRAWLDLQNDVTVKDVELAARENFASVEHMKRYTTQGMAPDQGKSSNVLALAILAEQTGRSIPETGTTTFRPPFAPVTIAAMGAHGKGRAFAAERLTPTHQAALDRGAPMVEVGLWFRPSWFPRPGETTWRQSCDREVRMVREAVGVCDVSTLGKIEVHGADAARFLDFVYANRMSRLKSGRVRYGLMLREDGFVMDDGTCARLGRDRFLLTTTTAAAGEVMAHLEFVRQVLQPEWDVRLASVTENWAQVAVTGPLARAAVNALMDTPLTAEQLPYMVHRDVRIGGVAGRVFRISFSGELGFELAVPARFGDSLFRLAVAQAETLGGGAYGLEALNVLRIEKGFLTHAEISGRATADDLGLGRMLSPEKDFIGKRMAARPGLRAGTREQLVGLRPAGAVKAMTAGARLFEQGAEVRHENMQGHVTSAGFSPTFGHFIALAMLENGRARIGETIRVLDRMRDLDALCEVVNPVFFDPAGGRMRG
ncbi:MAG TPA: sarcosine oxidase subunit alpha, partial [Rhodobacteraceae bacterium]|nr:sarcosine oxidase subunit alpha [Paracoccaceae bacterium]